MEAPVEVQAESADEPIGNFMIFVRLLLLAILIVTIIVIAGLVAL
jgi:hypothetical protein